MGKNSFVAEEKARLDEVLAKYLNISRSQAQKYVRQGVLVDDVSVDKNGYIVKEKQVISYFSLEPKAEAKPDLDILPYEVVFEDNDVLLINKPRGLVVHPAAGHRNDTLVNYLVHHYQSIAAMAEAGSTNRPGIVHRIDKDTSGLLVVAKTPAALISLGDQVALHMINREYLCIVHGVPAHRLFKVDAAIGRDPKNRKKMAVVPEEYGRRAVTHFKLLWTNGKYSVLQCILETGRTHQIRVHLAYFHLPIVGDPLYGIESDGKIYTDGQLLHAYKIRLEHPITKKEVTFYARVDGYFQGAIRQIIGDKKR